MGRIRICQLITDLTPAGAERCVYELVRRLDRDRFDVRVAALRGGRMADWLAEAGVRVTVLGVRGKWDVGKLWRLTGLLRDERIDLLHTHLFHADLAGRPAARSASVPHLVHTVHVAEMRFRPWQFAMARFLADWCDRIICVSDSVRRRHARKSGLPGWRYTVIPNGIDAEAYARDDKVRAALRRQWGLGADELLLVFVGRLNRQKGVDTLLGAMSHLAARGCPRKIVIAGDGPMRGMVENWTRHGEGGHACRLLGFVDNVRDVLSAADIFVLPSRWEGLPLAGAEAMAAGLPVVATRVSGLCDIIADGQTGLLVEPDNIVALAGAVERLCGDADERVRLGQAGRGAIGRMCGIDANIAAHEVLYEQVVGNNIDV